ncbi:MAG: hypothetical protein ABJA80_15820 [bacterium]
MEVRWQIVIRKSLPAIALGVLAFTLVLVITDPPGPGLDPDALSYMGSAETLAAHAEYRVPTAAWTRADSMAPLAHFPPGFPTLLAVPVRAGMAPAQAARLVEAVAAFTTITTLVLLVGGAVGQGAAVLLALALFAMTSMQEVHVSILSEPLYLTCTVLVLAALVHAPLRPLRAGLAAGAAVMTRYAGASLVGAVALWALLQPGRWRARLRRVALALAPAVVLQGAWVIRTRLVAGPGEIRRFALYGNLGPTLREGGSTLAAWLIPEAGPDPIPYHVALALAAGLALATLVAVGAWRAWRATAGAPLLERPDPRSPAAWRLLTATSLLLGCYVAIVAVSRVLADPRIPLDERILAPALLLLMTLAATGLALWWRSPRSTGVRIVVAAGLLAWWVDAASATREEVQYALEWGSDFAGSQWRESELLEWARTTGASAPLYSNWPPAVYFYLHRPAREVPRSGDPRTLAAFADTLRVRGGRVLLFDAPSEEQPPAESFRRAPGLREIAHPADGVVLGARP